MQKLPLLIHYLSTTLLLLCPYKTCHRITKVEKSGKIVANQGIWMETAE